jgi:transketolase N-terminal domain/subunit
MAGSAILSLPTSASSLPDSPSDAGTMDTPDGDLGPGLSIAMAATIAAAIKK